MYYPKEHITKTWYQYNPDASPKVVLEKYDYDPSNSVRESICPGFDNNGQEKDEEALKGIFPYLLVKYHVVKRERCADNEIDGPGVCEEWVTTESGGDGTDDGDTSQPCVDRKCSTCRDGYKYKFTNDTTGETAYGVFTDDGLIHVRTDQGFTASEVSKILWLDEMVQDGDLLSFHDDTISFCCEAQSNPGRQKTYGGIFSQQWADVLCERLLNGFSVVQASQILPWYLRPVGSLVYVDGEYRVISDIVVMEKIDGVDAISWYSTPLNNLFTTKSIRDQLSTAINARVTDYTNQLLRRINKEIITCVADECDCEDASDDPCFGGYASLGIHYGKYTCDEQQPPSGEICNADLSGNGEVGIEDVNIVLDIVLGKFIKDDATGCYIPNTSNANAPSAGGTRRITVELESPVSIGSGYQANMYTFETSYDGESGEEAGTTTQISYMNNATGKMMDYNISPNGTVTVGKLWKLTDASEFVMPMESGMTPEQWVNNMQSAQETITP